MYEAAAIATVIVPILLGLIVAWAHDEPRRATRRVMPARRRITRR